MVRYAKKYETLFKCGKCKAIFHHHEIKVKYKNGSNVCDKDKTTHCPKCDSEYFSMQ